MAKKKNSCMECGIEEGDIMQYGDNGRTVVVKLVKGRYGRLCQRHARNAYARATTANKRKTKRQREREEQIKQSGQLSMFD